MAATRMRMKDFSFAIKDGWQNSQFQELEDIQHIVNESIETYRLLKKGGKFKEADMCKAKIKESMYAQNHLKLVMNMDFDRPSQQTIEMARENGINLKNEKVKDEFRKIQMQNLKDIQLMKEGKLPDPKERENEIDLGQKLQLDRDKEFQRRLKEAQGEDYVEPAESTAASSDSTKGSSTSRSNGAKKNGSESKQEKKGRKSSALDYIIVVGFVLAWLAMFVARNYPGLLGIKPKAPAQEKEEEFTLDYK